MPIHLTDTRFRAWYPSSGPHAIPLALGKVYTYESGTNTPKESFSDEAMQVPNTNPVILDGAGSAVIILEGSYKIIVTDEDDVVIDTIDPLSSESLQVSSWGAPIAATYVSSSTFTVAGNQAADFPGGLPIQMQDTAGFKFPGIVTGANYDSGTTETTVTVFSDNGVPSQLESVSVSLLERDAVPMLSYPEMLNGRDLNGVLRPGPYAENKNDNAKLTANYPVERAGALHVYKIGELGPSAAGVVQVYYEYQNANIWTRASQDGVVWSTWNQLQFSIGNIDWGSITGKPATATRWPAWGEVTGKPATATSWPTWAQVTGKPGTFPPAAHSHTWSSITGKPNITMSTGNPSGGANGDIWFKV